MTKINFWPNFHKNLFFIHLNQKQNSRLAIRNNYKGSSPFQIETINELTDAFLSAKSLDDFQKTMDNHENCIGNLIGHTPVHQKLFSDYQGSIKSLGAWGGDFFLATGNNHHYFKDKGYTTIIPFGEMVKSDEYEN